MRNPAQDLSPRTANSYTNTNTPPQAPPRTLQRHQQSAPVARIGIPQLPGDLELIYQSQAGDADAFGQLVTKFSPKILTVLYGIVRDEHDARDLAQEGFLKAWRSIHQFDVAV